MHISANIIRFPEIPTAHQVGVHEPIAQPPAEVVDFPALDSDLSFDERAQQHGQFHVAHRIATRLANQIEALASL